MGSKHLQSHGRIITLVDWLHLQLKPEHNMFQITAVRSLSSQTINCGVTFSEIIWMIGVKIATPWNTEVPFSTSPTDIYICRISLHLIDVYSSVLTPVWTFIESMHWSLELLSHGTGSAASCCTHTCFNEESELYIFRFLSCELSLSLSLSYTNTHTYTREFTFDYIKLLASPVKILTVAYFCSGFFIPIFSYLFFSCSFFCSFSLCFPPSASYVFFHHVFLFFFAVALCQVMLFSKHCCVNICHKRNNKISVMIGKKRRTETQS